jgi:hypothetical protein
MGLSFQEAGRKKCLMIASLVCILAACSTSHSPALPAPTTPPTAQASAPSALNLDFDNPRLHQIAGDHPLIIDEFRRVNYGGFHQFVALIVETGHSPNRQELLIFQVKDDTSTLIYDLGPFYWISFEPQGDLLPFWLYDTPRLRGFSGFYNDSPVILPVFISNGGNCSDCVTLRLIGISDFGEATDVSPSTNFNPKGFVEVRESGISDIQLVATQYYDQGYGACRQPDSPFAFRLFKWNDTAYEDVSTLETGF